MSDIFISSVDPEDAGHIWDEENAGREINYYDATFLGSPVDLTKGEKELEKQLIPVADDVFLSLFLGGRNPERDPVAIMWKYMLSGRSTRIRRPYHAAWAMLRRVSHVNAIIGMCIRFIVQEFRTLHWTVEPLKKSYEDLARIARMLFRYPTPMETWTTFQDKILIELLTIDAAPIEIWYGKYIPFNITWERTRLERLQKEWDKIKGNPNDVNYKFIRDYLSLTASRLSFLLAVEEERVRNLPSWLGVSETELYRSYSLLKDHAEKLEKNLKDLPILDLDASSTYNEILIEHMEKAKGLKEPKRALDLPVAFNPIPGDQIEIYGDTLLMMMDYMYPFRRVIFENVVGKYTREQLVYLREYNRVDSFYGMSPIEAVLLVAYSYLMAHDVQFRYFTRSNVPAGVFIAPGRINIDALRRRFREMLMSPERIVFLSQPPGVQGSYQWIQLSNINREIQFTEILTWYTRLMILAFGLQPWEVGFESGSVSKRQLRIRPGIMGRMKYLENAFNDMLLIQTFRADPSGIIFRYYGIDVGDFNEESQALNNVVFKLLTLDEARTRLGLPPLENGLSDYLFVPSGTGVFLLGKKKKTIDEEVSYDTPEKTVGMWTAIAGGLPKGMEAGGAFPAAPTLLQKINELRKSLPTDDEYKQFERNLSERQRAAIYSFAKAMTALEITKSPEEGLKLSYRIWEEMRARLTRPPQWNEFTSELGQYLLAAYDEKLRKDVRQLLEGSVDLKDIIGEPPAI